MGEIMVGLPRKLIIMLIDVREAISFLLIGCEAEQRQGLRVPRNVRSPDILIRDHPSPPHIYGLLAAVGPAPHHRIKLFRFFPGAAFSVLFSSKFFFYH